MIDKYPDGSIYKTDEQGNLHCEDGPAVIFGKGSIGKFQYWIKGKCHRLDGPAVINADGCESWMINGKFIPVFSQEEFERYLRLMAFI